MINGLRVTAITPLHFGVDYLPYAMRSVADVVDEFLIMYSPVPNHGTYSSALPCPESRDDLIAAAYQIAPEKTRWFDHNGWRSEGEQFKEGWQYTDADVIVKLDADECWHPNLLKDAVWRANQENAYEVRVPLRHYWRSFRKAFTRDPAAPGRIYLRHNANGRKEITFNESNPAIYLNGKIDKDEWDRLAKEYGNQSYIPLILEPYDAPEETYFRIHHYGYALPIDVTRYKMGIHGHKAEFPNPNWFDEVWLANRQTDCHPIGSDYWMQTEDVDVPEFMQDHPFANLEVIE